MLTFEVEDGEMRVSFSGDGYSIITSLLIISTVILSGDGNKVVISEKEKNYNIFIYIWAVLIRYVEQVGHLVPFF